MSTRKAPTAKRHAKPPAPSRRAQKSSTISVLPSAPVEAPRGTQGAAPAKFVPAHGNGQLQRGGTPGNKGGTGRPPDEFRARMRELATYTDKQKHIEAVLNNPEHPQWLPALRHVTEHGYGRAIQPVDLAQTIEVVIRFEDEPAARQRA